MTVAHSGENEVQQVSATTTATSYSRLLSGNRPRPGMCGGSVIMTAEGSFLFHRFPDAFAR